MRALRLTRPITDFELGLNWSCTPEYLDWAWDHKLDPTLLYGLSLDISKQEVQVYQWEEGEDGRIAVESTPDGPRLKHRRPYKIKMLYPPANLPIQAIHARRAYHNPLVADHDD